MQCKASSLLTGSTSFLGKTFPRPHPTCQKHWKMSQARHFSSSNAFLCYKKMLQHDSSVLHCRWFWILVAWLAWWAWYLVRPVEMELLLLTLFCLLLSWSWLIFVAFLTVWRITVEHCNTSQSNGDHKMDQYLRRPSACQPTMIYWGWSVWPLSRC